MAKTTSVMAVGCRYNDADSILDPFDTVGLDVLSLDSGSLAAARACANVLGGQGGISAILDLGWRSASLIILHDQTIIYDRPLGEAGIEQLYKDLSNSLGIKFDVIDIVISQTACPVVTSETGSDAHREIALAIASHFTTLLKDLELILQLCRQYHYASSTVDRLLLIGGGVLRFRAWLDNWTQHLGMKKYRLFARPT